MGRLTGGSWAVALCGALALSLGALTGCGGGPDKDPGAGQLSAAQRAEIDDIYTHLNNRSDRWREKLIDAGNASPAARRYVIQVGRDEVEKSQARSGQGVGVLRGNGRQRVMEVVGALGKDPEGQKLLALGLDDALSEVQVAAAAALAKWGQGDGLSVLIEVATAPDTESEERQVAVQALRRLATPERQEQLLRALRGEGQEYLEPVVLATFPKGPNRAQALRDVAGEHPSPYARAFALRALFAADDPEVRPLAEKALRGGDRALQPVAMKILGSAGGAQAAAQIEAELRDDPVDPRAGARGLYEVGSRDALERAVGLFADTSVASKTRVAVAQEFLGRIADSRAPAAYQDEDAQRLVQGALRDAVRDERGDTAQAAVTALGRVGLKGADEELLMGVLDASGSRSLRESAVGALSRIGAELAAAKLVELIEYDEELRGAAADALGRFEDRAVVPLYALVDLLENDEVDVRRAALQGLLSFAGRSDPMGYDPSDETPSRDQAIERWRQWVSEQG